MGAAGAVSACPPLLASIPPLLSSSPFSSSPRSPPHPSAALMSDVYDDHKDADGFLYMTFAGENTFGKG